MDLYKSRRSTRRFKDEPLEREKLDAIIEAGRYAPSGGNNQSTHFLVIEDKEVLKKLAEMAEQAFAAMEVTEGMYRSMAGAVAAAKKGNYVFQVDI